VPSAGDEIVVLDDAALIWTMRAGGDRWSAVTADPAGTDTLAPSTRMVADVARVPPSLRQRPRALDVPVLIQGELARARSPRFGRW
jgi:hypothetical protein